VFRLRRFSSVSQFGYRLIGLDIIGKSDRLARFGRLSRLRLSRLRLSRLRFGRLRFGRLRFVVRCLCLSQRAVPLAILSTIPAIPPRPMLCAVRNARPDYGKECDMFRHVLIYFDLFRNTARKPYTDQFFSSYQVGLGYGHGYRQRVTTVDFIS